MAANNVETAFLLPVGVSKDFMRNLLWQHQQQQQQENINHQQQNINQFTCPSLTSAMSETLSGNAFDETEENDFDQENVDEEEINFISNSYSSLKQTRKRSFQSMSTIHSSTSEHVYHSFIHFRSWQ